MKGGPMSGKSAYEKEAAACGAELERVQARLKELRRQARQDHSMELRTRISLYEDLAVEMKVKTKEFCRRAKEEST